MPPPLLSVYRILTPFLFYLFFPMFSIGEGETFITVCSSSAHTNVQMRQGFWPLLQAKFEMDGFRNRDAKRLLQTFFGKSKQGNDFPTTRRVPCAPRHGLFSLHRALQKQTSQANDALTGLLSILIIILPHWMQLPSYTSKKNLSDTVSMFLFHSHRSQHKYIHSAYFSPRFPH